MNYCAVIGDIVHSRKLNNRQEIQDKFKKTLAEINSLYASEIASRFTVTLGDEFQGLLYRPALSYEIISHIKKKMAPVELVFGVATGQIVTAIDKDIAIGADGPAYHRARAMVERAKKKKPSICYCFNSPEDELINALLYFIQTCGRKRTRKQGEVVGHYERFRSQYKAAEILGIKQSSVSRILQNSFYYEIKEAEGALGQYLKSRSSTI